MIVQEFVLALEGGFGLSDMASAMPVYPSYAAVAWQLARQFQESRLLGKGYIQTALRLFYGFVPRLSSSNGSPGAQSEASSEAEPAAPSSSAHAQGH